MWALPSTVVLRDVTMRDGLQDERPISTSAKLAVFEAIVAAGVTDLELTSFVRPDRVPAMADAVELAQATMVDGVTRWGLVLNQRGAERALEAGLANLQLVISVSDAHGTRNAGRTVTEALADLVQIVTRERGRSVRRGHPRHRVRLPVRRARRARSGRRPRPGRRGRRRLRHRSGRHHRRRDTR